ncbi:hypothetical protein JKP88DRAFT_336666 [Tribonema minus]|uniref:Uncharacterized protein n=1 Tax=Tribonema minus TaxID=303371 RepID=A0A836C820_9STRA|nr:hypothetical protein JKP88DRAFT_336666 [Tribonema minus]
MRRSIRAAVGGAWLLLSLLTIGLTASGDAAALPPLARHTEAHQQRVLQSDARLPPLRLSQRDEREADSDERKDEHQQRVLQSDARLPPLRLSQRDEREADSDERKDDEDAQQKLKQLLQITLPHEGTIWNVDDQQEVSWVKPTWVKHVDVVLVALKLGFTPRRSLIASKTPLSSMSLFPLPYVRPDLVSDNESVDDFMWYIAVEAVPSGPSAQASSNLSSLSAHQLHSEPFTMRAGQPPQQANAASMGFSLKAGGLGGVVFVGVVVTVLLSMCCWRQYRRYASCRIMKKLAEVVITSTCGTKHWKSAGHVLLAAIPQAASRRRRDQATPRRCLPHSRGGCGGAPYDAQGALPQPPCGIAHAVGSRPRHRCGDARRRRGADPPPPSQTPLNPTLLNPPRAASSAHASLTPSLPSVRACRRRRRHCCRRCRRSSPVEAIVCGPDGGGGRRAKSAGAAAVAPPSRSSSFGGSFKWPFAWPKWRGELVTAAAVASPGSYAAAATVAQPLAELPPAAAAVAAAAAQRHRRTRTFAATPPRAHAATRAHCDAELGL